MLDQIEWLADKEELEFSKKPFGGVQAGKSWKYAQHLDVLIVIRIILFLMMFWVLLPAVTFFLFHGGQESWYLFAERLFYSILFAVSFALFNKRRNIAIVTGAVPLALILLGQYAISDKQPVSIYYVLLHLAILLFILSAFYRNHQMQLLRKELESGQP